MEAKLSEIFIFETGTVQYHKEALMVLEIKKEFVSRLAKHLCLAYLEIRPKDDNLCYAQNPNIRLGYRTVLSKSDILNYLDQRLQSGIYHKESDILFFNHHLDL
ncbi:hypothetical protein [Allomuricauda sp. M10]|uniref:hypothetical protein n=1 Tax=Allomuricauda sp. M10 TaxID=2683292 RepID=UPI001D192752|nr:hypothetical protein [Muricauda sp. M10]